MPLLQVRLCLPGCLDGSRLAQSLCVDMSCEKAVWGDKTSQWVFSCVGEKKQMNNHLWVFMGLGPASTAGLRLRRLGDAPAPRESAGRAETSVGHCWLTRAGV